MTRRLHVDRSTRVEAVELLVGEPAGEVHVRARERLELGRRVVEPPTRDDELDVGQVRRGLDEGAQPLRSSESRATLATVSAIRSRGPVGRSWKGSGIPW